MVIDVDVESEFLLFKDWVENDGFRCNGVVWEEIEYEWLNWFKEMDFVGFVNVELLLDFGVLVLFLLFFKLVLVV